MSGLRDFFFGLYTLFLLIFLIYPNNCLSDPAAAYFDPGMTHGVYGVNRYPTEKEDWALDLHLSPFYQHASGARDKDGNKVPVGDRLGRLDMFTLFWGDANAMPKAFTQANYDIFYTLSYDIKENLGIDESSYEGELDKDGNYSIPVTYEKKGFRLEADLAIKSGFGLTIKSGFVEYRQTPTFTDVSEATGDLNTFLTTTFMTPTTRSALIENELGLSLAPYQTVAFEDTFIQLYWSTPFELDDNEGNHIVTVHPYLGAGVWIPTGKKKNQDKAFSLPTGHDGFWGASLEGAINFDFPDTVLINIGGSVTFFGTKSLSGYRTPNHKYQHAYYPWKAKIKRRFGTAWNINLSLMSKNIVPDLDVFIDYLYSKHEKDSITINESDSDKKAAFIPQTLEDESLWKSQMLQLGFDYHVTPNLSIGMTGQTHISGTRVYKTHTVMGTLTFTF